MSRAYAVRLFRALIVCLVVVPAEARADDEQPAARASFALRARVLYPVTADQPGPIERGMIIVRDGKIVAVGRDLEVPPDLALIDLRDATVCPGFVSAGSALGGRHGGERSVSGAYRALDFFDTYARYDEFLARGTTTVHLDPGGHRLVSGRGATVKLAGRPSERALEPESALTINLGVFDPPGVVDVPFYASSDVAIEPARRQRPDSRLGQFLELERQIALAEAGVGSATGMFDVHARSFAKAWSAKLPLRIQVRRAADIEGALAFAKRHDWRCYLIGMTEGDELVEALEKSGLPVVLRLEQRYRGADANLGPHPDALRSRAATAGRLADAEGRPALSRVALAGREGDTREDLGMVAALAMRGGMPRERALAAITRIPAEILGVAERVGSLAPGKDADFLVLSGEPLGISSHVLQVYVAGRRVFEAPHTDRLVVKAGTVWVGDGSVIHDGALLIEGGKIRAIGNRVPHPPFARVIDAGRHGFVMPGFIDAHGHLGLQGDRTRVGPDLPIHGVVGVAGREQRLVAEAGVTTVILSPYRVGSYGGRMAAVKTYGRSRRDMLVRELTGMKFILGSDPLVSVESLRKALEAGKKYDKKWKEYYQKLKKWEEDRAKGVAAGQKPKEELVEQEEESKVDPITGTWEWTVSGPPLPEDFSGTATLKLSGTRIEGRINIPQAEDELLVEGELSGEDVHLEIDFETGSGRPEIDAKLDREDHMAGEVKLGDMFSVGFAATRTDKSAVEFKVSRRRRRKDGRPEPPKVNEKLEPYRALLAGEVPAVVQARTAGQIKAALELLVDEYGLRVVLLGGEDSADVSDELEKRIRAAADGSDENGRRGALVGVVVPPTILRPRDRVSYNQAADLSRRGIPVALQSDAEDGARALPLMGLYAVQQGLGGDAALRALTVDAARMYGIDDRVGTLEVGKDADILIYTGHPFDAAGRLERVIVGGREVAELKR